MAPSSTRMRSRAAASRAAGSGLTTQELPASLVSRSPRHAPEAHGLVPSAQPVFSDTKVTDNG